MLNRPLLVYLLVAFGFSWALGAGVYALGPQAHPLARVGLMTLYMFGPALGAVAARWVQGAQAGPWHAGLPINRWWLVAWLVPLAVQPLVLGSALFMPGVELSPDLSGMFERMAPALTPEQLAEARAELDAVPPLVFWGMLLGQTLVAGASINAVAAFGEELGWRGFLYTRLAGLGFWPRAAGVGAIWGLWHAPLILQGHNYPQHPALGVLAMTVFCVLLAPLMDLVRARGGSVWAAAVAHGSVNASAGLGLLLLRGGDDLTVGLTGLPGLGVLAGLNLVLWAADRARGGALTRDEG